MLVLSTGGCLYSTSPLLLLLLELVRSPKTRCVGQLAVLWIQQGSVVAVAAAAVVTAAAAAAGVLIDRLGSTSLALDWRMI